MKIISIICVSLSILFFQNNNEEWLEYYSKINQANREIYHSDYQKAELHINEAFTLVKSPHSNDIVKLIFCRNKNSVTTSNQKLLTQLVKDKKINPAQLKFELTSILSESDLAFLDEIPFEKHTTDSKSVMIDIIVTDQAVRDYSICNELDDQVQQRICYDELYIRRDSVDEANAQRLIALVNKDDIPSENSLGTYLYEEDASSTFNNLFYILGIHFMQTEHRSKILDIYKNGLTRGLIHPDVYAAVADFANENTIVNDKHVYDWTKSYLSTTLEKIGNGIYKPFIHYTDTLLQNINQNRLSIGLDSLHVYQQQAVCSTYCKGEGKKLQINAHVLSNDVPQGFAKAAFAKEGQDMENYRIDVNKILKECNCADKSL